MPQSIRTVSTRVASAFRKTVAAVALNRNITLPPVGTHLSKTKRIHGRTEVRVLHGFSDGLKTQKTVGELRAHLACHLSIAGRLLQPTEILIFGQNKKTLNGHRLIF
jgi:hypothetical protein